jgi:hypothetical protein
MGFAVGRIHRWALGVRLGALAAVLAAFVAAFGVLGALEFDGASLALFDLDGEGKPPAIFSALVDIGAGVLALVVYEGLGELRWLLFGVLLAFIGIDDLLTVHEHLQTWTGVDWVFLYLPLVAGGGVVCLLVMARLVRAAPRAAGLLVAGAAAWLAAYVAEQLEYTRGGAPVERYATLATIEETLEMAGSCLFVFALLLTIRRLARAR